MRVICALNARQVRVNLVPEFARLLQMTHTRAHARQMRVICASYARQVRVNIVPESARHLQMTRTRQMRVICAAGTRECCAGIRASFTNDAYANSVRGYA